MRLLRPALIVFIFVSSLLAAARFTGPVLAERMESATYVIQFGNFNITSGEKSSASYNVTDTVGQTGAGPYGQYGSSGYFIGGGFQYIYQTTAFSFVLSKITIDFGQLLIGEHAQDSHTVTITSMSPSGYTVYAYQEHPLQLLDASDEIPNATCDAGTCTISNAQIWTNQSVPGFGFNISGHDVPADFINTTYFRPFADRSLSQPMQVVMSASSRSRDREATVTYQAGIGATEAAGDYATGVVYVAVPGY